MIETLLPIAAKSFLVAGGALLLLRLAAGRSAAERSWIAHLGLLAALLLPIAATALPAIEVRGPAFLTPAAPAPELQPMAATPVVSSASQAEPATTAVTLQTPSASLMPSIDWAFWAYALPASLLLLLTLVALARLFALQARARVLVEPRWLTALARAQHRMGFKHGTALLISDELPSPISWGLVRPVILLNARAAEATSEAEAIIAHELAHVARLDWLKLLLARVTTAIYWFNPLVWLLAREAHQLREETADDAVLAADIADTDYAELLVGIARHECRGMLIGAHGVAPGKGSLARRVARVLDPRSARGPAARSFALGVFVGAAAIAAPLAAITFVPAEDAPAGGAQEYYRGASDIPRASLSDRSNQNRVADVTGDEVSREIAAELHEKMTEFGEGYIGPRPGTTGPQGQVGPRGPVGPRGIDSAVAARAVGVTPDYIRSIRGAGPQLRSTDTDDLVALRALGVTPAFIRELESAGYGGLSSGQLSEAKALGINRQYIRGLASAGIRNPDWSELVAMKALGVTPSDIQRLRSAGYGQLTADQVVELKAIGGTEPHIDVDFDPDPDPDYDPDPHDH